MASIKPSLQLRLGQQLTMTPQLQQAIRLLQLSTLELQTEIQEILENNPMLETTDSASEYETEQSADDESASLDESTVDNDQQELNTQSDNIPDELPVDSAWDDIYDIPALSSHSAVEFNGKDNLENFSDSQDSLQKQLLWQMHLQSMSDIDRAIAIAIIDAVDDDGYLTEDIELIHANLAEDYEIELDEVIAIQHLIQRFDPVGCASRDLAECLYVQLQQMPSDTRLLQEAQEIAKNYLSLLAAHDVKQLMRKTRLSEQAIMEIATLIQSLNPRPGSEISNRTAEYIVPDVRVYKYENAWRVELNPEVIPRLRINPYYSGMVKRADNSDDNSYLRNHLQEARWFIKSLQSRNDTLLKVAKAIVEHQRGFLEYGEQAMKPLVLRDIAEQLDMHESTISRVTTNKYMHTPSGIYEFKFFFSSHVATVDGGECSAIAIRAMIKKLIAEESPVKPFSDSRIASTLVSLGINVARRTVAKYREAMNIPSSNERKRLT